MGWLTVAAALLVSNTRAIGSGSDQVTIGHGSNTVAIALGAGGGGSAGLGTNLVVNGDAESGVLNVLPSGWTASGPNAADFFVADAYFGENVQTVHGKVLEIYSTLPNREATLSQVIDVSSLQSQISTGRVALSFSAQGFSLYGATVSYTIEELSASDVVLNSHTSGSLTLFGQSVNYHSTDSSACTWTTTTITAIGLNAATVKLRVSIYGKTSNNSEDYVDFDDVTLVLSAPPGVTTASVTTFGKNSATLGGTVATGTGDDVTERGVVYSSTNTTPSIGGTGVTKNRNELGAGTFGKSIGSLAAGTTYYVRAYATNAAGTEYGGVVSFTTAAPPSMLGVAPPESNTYAVGQILDYTANFTEAVSVVTTGGTPYLTLTVGGSTVHAAYQSGSGTSAIKFRYTIASGDLDVDGVALASNVTLNGGTIQDAAGNNATLTFSGSTAANVQVDARTAQTITFGSLPTQTYGTAALKLTASSSSGLAVSYASSKPAVARISNDTVYLLKADTATITADQAGNGTWKPATSVSQKLTIGKKALTITGATAQNKTYDGTATATLSGGSLSGVEGSESVTLSLGTASFANKNAETGKAVTVTGSGISGPDAGNYTLTEVTGLSAKIEAYPLTVTVRDTSKNQGSSDPTFSWSAGPLFSGDSWTGALSRAPGEAAGAYDILQGSLSAGPDYAITFHGAKLTIQPSSGLSARPSSRPVSRELSLNLGRVLSSRALGRAQGALGEGRPAEGEQSLEILLPGAATVSVSIFDNLGTPVIAWSRDVSVSEFRRLAPSGDGRAVLGVRWNLRSSNGEPVPSGVYLWKVLVTGIDGQKLETVKRTGVR